MRQFHAVMVWLPSLLLTAGMVSHKVERTPEREHPAVDRLLSRGDIQVAQAYLIGFSFYPDLVDGIYPTKTQAAVRAY